MAFLLSCGTRTLTIISQPPYLSENSLENAERRCASNASSEDDAHDDAPRFRVTVTSVMRNGETLERAPSPNRYSLDEQSQGDDDMQAGGGHEYDRDSADDLQGRYDYDYDGIPDEDGCPPSPNAAAAAAAANEARLASGAGGVHYATVKTDRGIRGAASSGPALDQPLYAMPTPRRDPQEVEAATVEGVASRQDDAKDTERLYENDMIG